MGVSQAKLDGMLIDATKEGKLDGVTELLTKGAKVESSRDNWGRSPVHVAAYLGNEQMLSLLITSSSSPTRGSLLDQVKRAWSKDSTSRTPLHEAAQQGHVEIGKILLLQHTERSVMTHDLINSADHSGITALHVAASNGHRMFVRMMLLCRGDQGGAKNVNTGVGGKILLNPNIQDKNGDTALHNAVQRGHKSVVELLLGLTPTGKSSSADTSDPAVQQRDVEFCKTDIKNARGETALDCAPGTSVGEEIRALFAAHHVQVLLVREEAASKTLYGKSSAMMSSAWGSVTNLFSTKNKRGSNNTTPPPPRAPPAPPTAGGGGAGAQGASSSAPPPPYGTAAYSYDDVPEAPSCSDTTTAHQEKRAPPARGPASQEVWMCSACTLFNQPNATACSACQKPKYLPSLDGTEEEMGRGGVSPPPPYQGGPPPSATGADHANQQEAMRREIERLRQEKEAAEEKARLAEQQQPSSGTAAPPAVLCCICLDAAAEYLMVPCGHQCLCSGDCKDHVNASKECPMCKSSFTQMVKVFTA